MVPPIFDFVGEVKKGRYRYQTEKTVAHSEPLAAGPTREAECMLVG